MIYNSRNISNFLVLLFLTGFLSASFHLHLEEAHTVDAEPPHLIQDHNFCSLCASQFFYNESQLTVAESDVETGEFIPELRSLIIASPLVLLQNYRAPPLFS
jgi:hypothetical protein